MYKNKGERTECWDYRDITMLSVVGKIYEKGHRVTEDLVDDEGGGFRSGRGYVD